MLPKSKTLKEERTEVRTERIENILWIFLVTGRVVGLVAGIDTRIFTLPREISNHTCYGLRSQQRS